MFVDSSIRVKPSAVGCSASFFRGVLTGIFVVPQSFKFTPQNNVAPYHDDDKRNDTENNFLHSIPRAFFHAINFSRACI
jgi:hypothetical protein